VPIKGFAAIEDMALINVEGDGMIGIPGVRINSSGAASGGCLGCDDLTSKVPNIRSVSLSRGGRQNPLSGRSNRHFSLRYSAARFKP